MPITPKDIAGLTPEQICELFNQRDQTIAALEINRLYQEAKELPRDVADETLAILSDLKVRVEAARDREQQEAEWFEQWSSVPKKTIPDFEPLPILMELRQNLNQSSDSREFFAVEIAVIGRLIERRERHQSLFAKIWKCRRTSSERSEFFLNIAWAVREVCDNNGNLLGREVLDARKALRQELGEFSEHMKRALSLLARIQLSASQAKVHLPPPIADDASMQAQQDGRYFSAKLILKTLSTINSRTPLASWSPVIADAFQTQQASTGVLVRALCRKIREELTDYDDSKDLPCRISNTEIAHLVDTCLGLTPGTTVPDNVRHALKPKKRKTLSD